MKQVLPILTRPRRPRGVGWGCPHKRLARDFTELFTELKKLLSGGRLKRGEIQLEKESESEYTTYVH